MLREGSRPAKRAKIEDCSDPASTASTNDEKPFNLGDLKRDQDFWLEDGTVVLCARGVGFKVYKALLAAQSPVFSDMFSNAQPDKSQLPDGCPVVYLSDSPQDLRHLLAAILPKSNVRCVTHLHVAGHCPDRFWFPFPSFYKLPKEYNIHQLSAVIRLSHKYLMNKLEEQALSVFHHYLPTTYDTWLTTPRPDDPLIGIEAIHIARLTGTSDLLPVAFFTCTRAGGSVLKGWVREDGTIVRLSDDDAGLFIDSLQRLGDELRCMLNDVFKLEDIKSTCSKAAACQEALQKYNKDIIQHNYADTLPIVYQESANVKQTMTGVGLCKKCATMVEQRFLREHRRLWDLLPRIFSLCPADELEEQTV